MPYCTSCQKAIATIQITDLEGGSVVGHQFLCGGCAAQHGLVGNSKIPGSQPEFLEELLSGLAGKKQASAAETSGTSCPACGMTLEQLRLRGRLGCARCYEVFHNALVPLLERIHDASSHRGSYPPGEGGQLPAEPEDDNRLRALKDQLDVAIREERYEEAARLRDALREDETEEE